MRPKLSILPGTAAGVPPAYWTAELIRASPLKLVKLMIDTGTPPRSPAAVQIAGGECGAPQSLTPLPLMIPVLPPFSHCCPDCRRGTQSPEPIRTPPPMILPPLLPLPRFQGNAEPIRASPQPMILSPALPLMIPPT